MGERSTDFADRQDRSRDHGLFSLNRRTFSLGLAVGAFALFNPFSSSKAFAEPTSAEKQAEADEVKARLDSWRTELEEASREYHLALEAHDSALVAMDEAKARIEAAEAKITDLQSKLGNRAANMYRGGPLTFLDVLFGASSFEEFTTTWDLLNGINQENATLIEQTKTAKQEAEAAHQEYTHQEKLAAQKLAEAEKIKADAEVTVSAYETELANLNEEIKELIRKEEEAEAARQAAAAAAAANQGSNNGGGSYRGDGTGNYDVGTYNSVVEAAYSRLGGPYVWAATGPNSFDCSGLTQWCYRQVGISIPRVDTSQRAAASSILPVSEAQPGDILWMWGHVGIYIGGGQYIHAPQPGDVVRIASNMGMWQAACRY